MSNVIKKNLTLAQFMRDAAAGGMTMEMTYWFGKTGRDIRENLQGERSVVRTNSVGVFLRKQGTSAESELQLPRAALIQYTGDTLTVFAPVERDPNEQESGILAEWNRQEEELMKKNPLGDTYWKMKDFFGASSCPYMSGFESQKCQGKSYNRSTGKVRDSHIPGTMILRYNVRHLNCE